MGAAGGFSPHKTAAESAAGQSLRPVPRTTWVKMSMIVQA